MVSYRVRLFSLLWSVAVIFSLTSSSAWLVDIANFWSFHLASIIAVFLLFRPESRILFRVSIISFIVLAFTIMPAIQNHRMVLAFAGVALLMGSWRDEKWSRSISDLRWLTIIVYLFAALAKCNADYLRDDISCATIFLRQSLELNGFGGVEIPSFLSGGSVSGLWSFLVEALLIILLIPRKTRAFGVLFGFSFHFLLATNYIKYFTNFSSVMFLVLSSWLTEEQCEYLVKGFFERYLRWFRFGVPLLFVSLTLSATGVLSPILWIVFRYILWSAFAIPICWVLCKVTIATRAVRDSTTLPLPHFVFVFIALLNGFSPYLGIRTLSTFSMYSNLRVEPDYTNHLFMPKSANLLPYLGDTVKILSSSDSYFVELVNSPTQRLPYLQLCSYVAEMDDRGREQDYEVTFERKGISYRAIRGGSLPADCPPWIARKLLRYGSIGDGAERQCVW